MNSILQFITNRKVILFTFLILLVNFILKIIFIESNDVAKDEPFSIFTAQMALPELVNYLKGGNNPPLYEIMLHFWIKLFGIGSLSVRLPSLIFSCLTAVVIFKIGNSLFSFSSGVTASLVFTFSSLHTYFAQEARVYPMFVFLASLAFLFLVSYLKDSKNKHLVWLGIVNILMLYAHYFAFFILLNQLLAILFFKQARHSYKQIIVLALIIAFFFLPMISSFVMQFYYSVDRGTWVEPPVPNHYYGFINIFINNKLSSFVYFGIIVFLSVYAFLKRKTIKFLYDNKNIKALLFVFLWFFVPYTIMFFSSFSAPMFIERYVLFTSVFLYLFLAAFVCQANVNKYMKILLAFLFLTGIVLTYNIKPYNKRDIAKAVDFVKQNKTAETIVLLCPDYYHYAFTYHYNIDFFKDYKNTRALLEQDKVFLLSAKTDLFKVPELRKSPSVVYFQSISQYVDPDNDIFKTLEEHFEIKEKRNFFEIYCVTVFYKEVS